MIFWTQNLFRPNIFLSLSKLNTFDLSLVKKIILPNKNWLNFKIGLIFFFFKLSLMASLFQNVVESIWPPVKLWAWHTLLGNGFTRVHSVWFCCITLDMNWLCCLCCDYLYLFDSNWSILFNFVGIFLNMCKYVWLWLTQEVMHKEISGNLISHRK